MAVWRQLPPIAPVEQAAAREPVTAAPIEVATVLAGMVLQVVGG